MLAHNADSFRKNGTMQIILGILSCIWQIGILICTSQRDIYEVKKEYARSISYSSVGFFAGLAFIASGLYSRKCCTLIKEGIADTATITSSIRVSKALDVLSIALAILLEIFSAYLASLTSHWYREGKIETATLAHAALPFHLLHCFTAIAELVAAILDLRVKPIPVTLPAVNFSTSDIGMENPAYTSSSGV